MKEMCCENCKKFIPFLPPSFGLNTYDGLCLGFFRSYPKNREDLCGDYEEQKNL